LIREQADAGREGARQAGAKAGTAAAAEPEAIESPEARAGAIRLLLFDVDGVLTDGSIAVSADGSESKSFNIRDGTAVVLAHRAGLMTGLLSGRHSEATSRRAEQLQIGVVVQSATDKLEAYEHLLREHELSDGEVAYMGDDLMDLPVLARAGLSAAPADAVEEVRARVHWVSTAGGGRGAARELVELVLRAQGRWAALVAGYDPKSES
jgi:3-deoxy-D-manno-octulosonate 8-phosphate phosphatase (KDO 8-P phosphatase)